MDLINSEMFGFADGHDGGSAVMAIAAVVAVYGIARLGIRLWKMLLMSHRDD